MHVNEADQKILRDNGWFHSLCPAVRRSTRRKLDHGLVFLANLLKRKINNELDEQEISENYETKKGW